MRVEEEQRKLFAQCILLCCMMINQYNMAFFHLESLERTQYLHFLVWSVIGSIRNATPGQVWGYRRNQQYFYDLLRIPYMDHLEC